MERRSKLGTEYSWSGKSVDEKIKDITEKINEIIEGLNSTC